MVDLRNLENDQKMTGLYPIVRNSRFRKRVLFLNRELRTGTKTAYSSLARTLRAARSAGVSGVRSRGESVRPRWTHSRSASRS